MVAGATVAPGHAPRAALPAVDHDGQRPCPTAGPEGAGAPVVTRYRGRFAPTPSGPLHAGSVVAALASWLDARAHGGTWVVRIEDTDTPRCIPGADHHILHQLDRLGLRSDEPVRWQSPSPSQDAYEAAWRALQAKGWAYGCACSRQDIERALARVGGLNTGQPAAAVYPGTCRTGLGGRTPRAWRVRVEGHWAWHDRRLGPQSQDLPREVGDFVIRRADGLWAYQLAVVVDDAAQGITDVVRGEDLADNTPRQQHLQRLLGLPLPRYLHTPLVWACDGQKLSKQTGAMAVDVDRPLLVLQAAAQVLQLQLPAAGGPKPVGSSPPDAAHHTPSLERWLEQATQAWAQRWLAVP